MLCTLNLYSCLVASHVQLFCDPWIAAHHVPLSRGFPRQGRWSGLPFPSPGDLLNAGIKPKSPTLQADSLPVKPQGKPNEMLVKEIKCNTFINTGISNKGYLMKLQKPPENNCLKFGRFIINEIKAELKVLYLWC